VGREEGLVRLWIEARISRAVTGLPPSLLRDRKRQYRDGNLSDASELPYPALRSEEIRPHSAQHDPEQSVGTAHARPLRSACQDNQLLPQGNDFKPQIMTGPTKLLSHMKQTQDQPKHESVFYNKTRQCAAAMIG
jgi:hypothetical protein